MLRGLLTALAALALAPAAAAGGPLLTLGAAEDVVRSPSADTAQANMNLLRLVGFKAVRITTNWLPGRTEPTEEEQTVLNNVAVAGARAGVDVYISIYHPGSRTTPLTPEARAEFTAYAAAVARRNPYFRKVIVGNEPNLNRFWLPQFAEDGSGASAPAYLQLLAETYDALKAVSPDVVVYGGALAPRGIDRPGTGRDTISPTRFIRELGAAYRASGRLQPVMDAFAIHPYADNSSQPPDVPHPVSTTIGVADYGKLVALLGEAFDGTAQLGSTLPILYDEFGVEAVVPPEKASLYTGTEPATTRPVDEATQAAYYRRALELTFCQPNVTGILFFHTHDEPGLPAWQSGVYYVDGTPKTSLPAVRAALAATRGGSVARCPGLRLKLKSTIEFDPRRLSVRFRCHLDCAYRLRLVKLPARSTTAAKSGVVAMQTHATVSLARRLRPGRYVLRLALAQAVNPGGPVIRESAPIVVR